MKIALVQSDQLSHPKYRADIDGLRAIAVLSVVAFHAFPVWVKGGFVGVDIFFVISGFLISSIIFENLARNTFSFAGFYARRIKRIFPALLVVLIVSYIFGWFALRANNITQFGEDEFRQLAKNVAAGAGFVSNFVLWKESGYFDSAAELKPLLHLWSLGIEEQFYILWPLLLWAAWKRKFNLLVITSGVFFFSFALNIWNVGSDVVATFYSPQTRFWELLLGSCLAYLMLFRQSTLHRIKIVNDNFHSFLGIALIVTGIVVVTNERAFPGWWALFPTFGAALVISAGSQAWPNRVILSNRILVWIGLISFPLYLWHWPLLAFARIAEGEIPPSREMRISIVLVSIGLAWLTYCLVEKPVRFGKHGRFLAQIVFLLMAGIGILALAPGLVLTSSELSKNQSEILEKLVKVTESRDLGKMYGNRPCFRYEQTQTAEMFVRNKCVDLTYPGRPTVFLIGDSHSASLSLGLRPLLESHKINFLQVSAGWCQPTNTDKTNIKCEDINALVLAKVAQFKPDIVIVDSHWLAASLPPFFPWLGDYEKAVVGKINELRNLGSKKIVIVGQMPIWKSSLPSVLSAKFVKKNIAIPTRTFAGINSNSLDMDTRMKAFKYPAETVYVSLKNALCNESGCLTMIGPDIEKDLVVWDYGHLTLSGAKYIARSAIEHELSGIWTAN